MIIDRVKVACEVTTSDAGITADLNGLIVAAKEKLKASGINVPDAESDIPELVLQAIILDCRMHFRSPANYDKLKAAYEDVVGLLMNASGYTNWENENE